MNALDTEWYFGAPEVILIHAWKLTLRDQFAICAVIRLILVLQHLLVVAIEHSFLAELLLGIHHFCKISSFN